MNEDSYIRLPQLGLTMTEGTVIEWHCEPGAAVKLGDLLAVVETEKIANEIRADRSGVIESLLVEVDDTVPVGTPLASWLGGNVTAASPAGGSAAAPEALREPPASVANEHPAGDGTRIIATPLARRLARERNIALERVAGSGPGGRIVARDVPAIGVPATPGAARPLARSRRVIGERMSRSQREIPHFYLTARAEISELKWLHEGLKQKPGLENVTLTHWIASAVGLVIAGTSRYRTVCTADGHVVLPDSDVGIAVAANDTLYAPIARRVGARGLAENAAAIDALVEAAASGTLAAHMLTGGAVTVSNLGAYDIDQVFPLINPGQSSILGVGRSQAVFRPDADGEPKPAHELSLVLACDHRVFNGTEGAAMLTGIKALLEDPLRIIAAPRPQE